MEHWQIENAKDFMKLTKDALKGLNGAIKALERNLNEDKPDNYDCNYWCGVAIIWTDLIQRNLQRAKNQMYKN